MRISARRLVVGMLAFPLVSLWGRWAGHSSAYVLYRAPPGALSACAWRSDPRNSSVLLAKCKYGPGTREPRGSCYVVHRGLLEPELCQVVHPLDVTGRRIHLVAVLDEAFRNRLAHPRGCAGHEQVFLFLLNMLSLSVS